MLSPLELKWLDSSCLYLVFKCLFFIDLCLPKWTFHLQEMAFSLDGPESAKQ
jgi:hypothetical protein